MLAGIWAKTVADSRQQAIREEVLADPLIWSYCTTKKYFRIDDLAVCVSTMFPWIYD